MTSYPKQLAAALDPAVARALDFLEAFINARNGRCLPSALDLNEAEAALWSARGDPSRSTHGAGTPGQFGRVGY